MQLFRQSLHPSCPAQRKEFYINVSIYISSLLVLQYQGGKKKKPPTNQNKIDNTCCNSIYCKTWSCCCRHHPSLARLRHFQHRSPPAGTGCRPWKSATCQETGPLRGCCWTPLAFYGAAKIHRRAAASHRALDARSKPLPARRREGWGQGEAPRVPAQGPAAGCSQPPGRHKGAQVINWSKGAKLLKRYSAKPARERRLARLLLQQARFIYLFILVATDTGPSLWHQPSPTLPRVPGSHQRDLSGRQTTITSPACKGSAGSRPQSGSSAGSPPRRGHGPAAHPSHHPPLTGRWTGFSRGHSEHSKNALHSPLQSLVLHSAQPQFAPEPGCQSDIHPGWTWLFPSTGLRHRTETQATLCGSHLLLPSGYQQYSVSRPVPRTCGSLAEAFLTSASCRQHRVCSAPRCPRLPAGGNQNRFWQPQYERDCAIIVQTELLYTKII